MELIIPLMSHTANNLNLMMSSIYMIISMITCQRQSIFALAEPTLLAFFRYHNEEAERISCGFGNECISGSAEWGELEPVYERFN